ncbi:alkaline phosphatase family protein [Halobium salinum]|uniref:Alkaline phosphatase family protein n=1 Tax=Halobium salinum TaxID=1364940 RepID=A0ABD5PAT9_9EURY|nr:alkaline phosphatase family protein [Halobium salinum]
METLLLGLDAACESVLEPLIEEGRLPNIERLLDDGVSGPLESQIPPWTPSAWPSLYTGVNPGKHGVFSFLKFDGYDWDVVNATDVRERTLWEILDEHGKSSVVVNAPVTSPPPAVAGAIIPGYTAPEDPDCHPADLLDEVREAIGDYRVYARDHEETPQGYVDAYRELIRMRGEAFRYLADTRDPDFGFLQFQQTDTVFHECPGQDEVVAAVYEAVDEQVGKVLEECEPETVMIVSDHGMGEYEGYEFRMNDYLRERGYVETAKGGEGMPTWSTIADDSLKNGKSGKTEDDGADGGPSPAERALALGAAVGLTSQRIHRALKRVGLADVVAAHAPSGLVRAASERVDFQNSKAYMRDRIECGVRINLDGREPNGVVSEAEYEPLRQELIEDLRALTAPDGTPVFDEVGPREDYFDGPYAEDAVDIVTVPREFDVMLSAQLHDEPFSATPMEPWNHKLDGIVSLTGPGVDTTASLAGAHLYDVASTVLSTFGIAYPETMDGRPLAPVVDVGTKQYDEYEPRAAQATDDAAVEERLADLGYLE